MRFAALIFGLLLLLLDPLAAAELQVQVLQVESGDRLLAVRTDGKPLRIRMAGLEAPARDRPGGNHARRHLQALLQGRLVNIEFRGQPTGAEVDARVRLGGADMNLRQIQAGLARFRPNPLLDRRDQALYAEAEATARKFRMGLWADR